MSKEREAERYKTRTPGEREGQWKESESKEGQARHDCAPNE